MKKIDNWLSIQRFVNEASQVTVLPPVTNVALFAKVQSQKRASRKVRRFLVPRITNI